MLLIYIVLTYIVLIHRILISFFIGRPSPAGTSYNTEQKRPSPEPIHHCSVARGSSPST